LLIVYNHHHDLTKEREPWTSILTYYSQLIDFVVTGVEFDTDEFDGTVFPVLLMMHPSGETVRVVVSVGRGRQWRWISVCHEPKWSIEKKWLRRDAGLRYVKNDGYQFYLDTSASI
jgi:hypothetical protein